jgi:hypothetical protein
MYMMVRKQLYLEPSQDRALKRRAKALGVSEADVVREALDALLGLERASEVAPGHQLALRELVDRASRFARRAEGGRKAARYRREELYEERERRWARRS